MADWQKYKSYGEALLSREAVASLGPVPIPMHTVLCSVVKVIADTNDNTKLFHLLGAVGYVVMVIAYVTYYSLIMLTGVC